MAEAVTFTDDTVALPGGRPRLAVRRAAPAHAPDPPGAGPETRQFVLVHGLASNARLWDGVATALVRRGYRSLAVDLRGHGRSEDPGSGYDTGTCADDLATLIDAEGLTGDRAPVAVGQSWGGNVVVSLAARHPGRASAVGCVDGGWIRLRDRFASFAECWAALAPPRLDGLTYDELARSIRAAHPDWPDTGIAGTLANLLELPGGGVRARLAREHHESIVRSLFEDDPREHYPRVTVPVLLVPAAGETPETGADDADDDDADARQARMRVGTRAAVREAVRRLPDAQVRWYPGADHDLHAQHPEQLAADLADLASRSRTIGAPPTSSPERRRNEPAGRHGIG